MDTPISRRTFLATPLLGRLMPGIAGERPETLIQKPAEVPTFRGNPARTGENPGPGPAGELQARWQVRLGTAITSSPAVVDNVVYVGTLSPGTVEGGALHAVDAETGIERWRLSTAPGDGIFSSPAVADGIVTVGTYDGVVFAADTETGEERWRFQAESSIWLQSPAVVSGAVYMTDIGGHLYALDAIDGTERWRFTSGDGVVRSLSSPAFADGVLYCVDASRRAADPPLLRAFDAMTGDERWSFTPADENGLFGTPVIVGSRAYLSTRGTFLLIVDTVTGMEHARHDVGVGIGTPLAVVSGIAYFGTEDGELHAVDVRTGEKYWTRQVSNGMALVSPPTVADGTVYVGDSDGVMYALDTVSGDERWRAGIRMLRSSPAIIGGVLYVGAKNGALRATGGSENAIQSDS